MPLGPAIALVLSIALSTLSATEPKAKSMPKAAISEYIQQYIDANRLYGVSIGVIQGESEWTAHFGRLSEDASSTATDATLYEIGSITKVFTGLLLADAVGEDSLELEQSIGSVAPELSDKNPKVAESITLLHLATHDSGLPRLPKNLRPTDRKDPYADYTRQSLFEYMSSVTPSEAPGSGSQYSNSGFGLLGELLALKAGTDYETLLRSKLLAPLGMTGTTISLSAAQSKNLAPPHTDGLEPTPVWNINGLSGAGAIRSNVLDMLRFTKMWLQPPDNSLNSAIELAWKKHLDAHGTAYAMGLGWIIARDGTTRVHDGQTSGSRSIMIANREGRAGVVVLGNTNTPDVGVIGEAIMTMLLGGKPPEPNPVYSVKVSEEEKQRLVGRYQIRPDFVVDIRLNRGWLIAQATNQQAFRIYPQSPLRWERKDYDVQAAFELPAIGQASAFTLIQGGKETKARRIR